MAAFAYTRLPRPPHGSSGFIAIKVYVVRPDGSRYDLPRTERPSGQCVAGLADCHCGATE